MIFRLQIDVFVPLILLVFSDLPGSGTTRAIGRCPKQRQHLLRRHRKSMWRT